MIFILYVALLLAAFGYLMWRDQGDRGMKVAGYWALGAVVLHLIGLI